MKRIGGIKGAGNGGRVQSDAEAETKGANEGAKAPEGTAGIANLRVEGSLDRCVRFLLRMTTRMTPTPLYHRMNKKRGAGEAKRRTALKAFWREKDIEAFKFILPFTTRHADRLFGNYLRHCCTMTDYVRTARF